MCRFWLRGLRESGQRCCVDLVLASVSTAVLRPAMIVLLEARRRLKTDML